MINFVHFITLVSQHNALDILSIPLLVAESNKLHGYKEMFY